MSRPLGDSLPMPAVVTLAVMQGKLAGQTFVFDQRTTCLIGKADGCHPRFPMDQDHRTISRHHCLLDINPPDVRVRDFGSRNGTYVNGQIIGKRRPEQSARQAAPLQFPEHDLNDGDEIRIGSATFRIQVQVPRVCIGCSAELPEGTESNHCVRCCQALETTKPTESLVESSVCLRCGRDVTQEKGQHWHGEMICRACRSEPRLLVEQLLSLARSGTPELSALRDCDLVGELGKGGMGAVFLARRPKSGESFALKVMLPQVAMNRRAKEQFQREIDNTRALSHPNVVKLLDAGCFQGRFYLMLEYCDGGSVEGLMRERGGKLPIGEAVSIILQALDGLEYAHHALIPNVKLADGRIGPGRGLVHRDVKPHNIYLSKENEGYAAKLGDYGLAKAFDLAGLSGQTLTGQAAGTPAFMPRQQLIDYLHAKPEVDVWAMAASLYFMLTGNLPRDLSHGDPWRLVLESDAKPIRTHDSSIPAGLANVIDQALVEKPAIYFQSAAEFKRALQKVL